MTNTAARAAVAVTVAVAIAVTVAVVAVRAAVRAATGAVEMKPAAGVPAMCLKHVHASWGTRVRSSVSARQQVAMRVAPSTCTAVSAQASNQ